MSIIQQNTNLTYAAGLWKELRLLPVVVFKSTGSTPAERTAALNVIVLQGRGASQQGHARVGYFWSTHQLVVDRVWAARQDVEDICIV